VFWKGDTGFVFHGWRVAGFYRGELFMESNKDTIEILRKLNLKETLPIGSTFNIQLEAEGFSASGVEVSKGISLSRIIEGLSAGITVRYLRGDKVQEALLTGNVTATSPNTYDFDMYVDYVYDKNYLYKRRDTVPGVGNGFSFDFGLKYEYNRYLSGEILFRDIEGRIYWQDVAFTTADATSGITSFDKDGFQVYRPTIRGFEDFKNFTQKIPLKTDITLSYTRRHFILTPLINFIEDRPLYWVFLGYSITDAMLLRAGYNTNYRVFSMAMIHKIASLSLYASDIDLTNTNALGFDFSLRYEW